MQKYSWILIVIMITSCQKNTPSSPVNNTKLSFYYENPKGKAINAQVITIPSSSSIISSASSAWHSSLFIAKPYGKLVDIKWKVIDSTTNKLLIQRDGNRFEYQSIADYTNGTQILKLYAFNPDEQNNPNRVPVDSISKMLHVSNRRKLKSIVVDSLHVSPLFVPDTANLEVFLRIFQRNQDRTRKGVVYYETPHLQNVRNLSTNIKLFVDTTKFITSADDKSSDAYTFVVCVLYKGRIYEALSNDIGPVFDSTSIAFSGDKNELLESRKYWEINQKSMMTINSSYTYMKGDY
jgi:hypothetical protein